MSKIRGVNIGNWMIMESWMNDKVLTHDIARDETDLCRKLGDKKFDVLKQHRDTFITFDDFKWIKNAGLNTVRIPIPHWIFGDFEPNVGCIEYLDKAMDWADKLHLNVLIDLHGAPGSQNGNDHSGVSGAIEFDKDPKNMDRAVDVLVKVAERYKGRPSLWGIQLLNEPGPTLSNDYLREYYLKAYRALRKIVDEKVAIVLHDQFNMKSWKNFMQEPEFKNVYLDVHIYQCFTDHEKKFTMQEHIDQQLGSWNRELRDMQRFFKIMIGEWSLGIGSKIPYKGKNSLQKEVFMRAFAAAQLIDYEDLDGWFFWAYKLNRPDMQGWNYRKSVENGWFPQKLK